MVEKEASGFWDQQTVVVEAKLGCGFGEAMEKASKRFLPQMKSDDSGRGGWALPMLILEREENCWLQMGPLSGGGRNILKTSWTQLKLSLWRRQSQKLHHHHSCTFLWQKSQRQASSVARHLYSRWYSSYIGRHVSSVSLEYSASGLVYGNARSNFFLDRTCGPNMGVSHFSASPEKLMPGCDKQGASVQINAKQLEWESSVNPRPWYLSENTGWPSLSWKRVAALTENFKYLGVFLTRNNKMMMRLPWCRDLPVNQCSNTHLRFA